MHAQPGGNSLLASHGFCLWLKRLEAGRFKTKPDAGDQAIELTVRELNPLLEGVDLWGNQPHKLLTPRLVNAHIPPEWKTP